VFLLLALAGWLFAFGSATAAKQKSGAPAVFE
jgi:hypothetical protein